MELQQLTGWEQVMALADLESVSVNEKDVRFSQSIHSAISLSVLQLALVVEVDPLAAVEVEAVQKDLVMEQATLAEEEVAVLAAVEAAAEVSALEPLARRRKRVSGAVEVRCVANRRSSHSFFFVVTGIWRGGGQWGSGKGKKGDKTPSAAETAAKELPTPAKLSSTAVKSKPKGETETTAKPRREKRQKGSRPAETATVSAEVAAAAKGRGEAIKHQTKAPTETEVLKAIEAEYHKTPVKAQEKGKKATATHIPSKKTKSGRGGKREAPVVVAVETPHGHKEAKHSKRSEKGHEDYPSAETTHTTALEHAAEKSETKRHRAAVDLTKTETTTPYVKKTAALFDRPASEFKVELKPEYRETKPKAAAAQTTETHAKKSGGKHKGEGKPKSGEEGHGGSGESTSSRRSYAERYRSTRTAGSKASYHSYGSKTSGDQHYFDTAQTQTHAYTHYSSGRDHGDHGDHHDGDSTQIS